MHTIFIGEVSEAVIFKRVSVEKSISINHHYGNVLAACCQHLTEISIKSQQHDELTDCSLSHPPPHSALLDLF